MSSDNNNNDKDVALNLISNEIKRLSKLSTTGSGLTIADVKALESLVKTRALLQGEATSISGKVKEEPKELSDEEVLKALGMTPPKPDKKTKKSKKDLN